MSNTDDNWQPIETAPKDGTEILVVEPDGEMYVAFWNIYESLWFYGVDLCVPTHWMPLPQPPQS